VLLQPVRESRGNVQAAHDARIFHAAKVRGTSAMWMTNTMMDARRRSLFISLARKNWVQTHICTPFFRSPRGITLEGLVQ
jgi:hypothetical protein